ncbi:MAG: hypothetical protein JO210_19230, partial [Acidobacteriaceae bacterium]|nr:hypothetical protein [Acidobacteriaceae bacterium]
MRSVLRPVSYRYRTWVDRWENDLCFRSNDRVVRPFDLGAEWAANWLPGVPRIQCLADLIGLNELIVRRSEEFFGYRTPDDFQLTDNWLSFASPVKTPYVANNTVSALWFPA